MALKVTDSALTGMCVRVADNDARSKELAASTICIYLRDWILLLKEWRVKNIAVNPCPDLKKLQETTSN